CEVFYFISRKSVVEGYCYGSCFQDAEIYWEPLETVHHQDGNSVSFFYASAQQHVGNSVGFFIKDVPCDFPSIWCRRNLRNKVVFLPCFFSGVLSQRIKLHQRHFFSV